MTQTLTFSTMVRQKNSAAFIEVSPSNLSDLDGSVISEICTAELCPVTPILQGGPLSRASTTCIQWTETLLWASAHGSSYSSFASYSSRRWVILRWLILQRQSDLAASCHEDRLLYRVLFVSSNGNMPHDCAAENCICVAFFEFKHRVNIDEVVCLVVTATKLQWSQVYQLRCCGHVARLFYYCYRCVHDFLHALMLPNNLKSSFAVEFELNLGYKRLRYCWWALLRFISSDNSTLMELTPLNPGTAHQW